MTEFTDFLQEVFVEFGKINTRKMFGGHGVYHDGVMFGLVADDVLYLKADGSIKQRFLERDLGPFQYPKGDKLVDMSYYQAPEEIYDDADEARTWARRSYAVALANKRSRR